MIVGLLVLSPWLAVLVTYYLLDVGRRAMLSARLGRLLAEEVGPVVDDRGRTWRPPGVCLCCGTLVSRWAWYCSSECREMFEAESRQVALDCEVEQ